MINVDVIKDDNGRKYVIPAGNPLPSDLFTYVRRNISQDEAKKLVPNSNFTKRSQAKC